MVKFPHTPESYHIFVKVNGKGNENLFLAKCKPLNLIVAVRIQRCSGKKEARAVVKAHSSSQCATAFLGDESTFVSSTKCSRQTFQTVWVVTFESMADIVYLFDEEEEGFVEMKRVDMRTESVVERLQKLGAKPRIPGTGGKAKKKVGAGYVPQPKPKAKFTRRVRSKERIFDPDSRPYL